MGKKDRRIGQALADALNDTDPDALEDLLDEMEKDQR